MMANSTKYYTLIGSLPALPRHFEQAERVPISPLKLSERLKMLEPEDAMVVEELRDFLVWERQSLERTDQDVLHRYDQFKETLQNAFAWELIHLVIAVRSIIVGLRCRRLQLDPPVGHTSIQAQIARNWGHPDFRLGMRFPWIGELEAMLRSETPLDVERKKLEIGWQYAKRLSEQYFFTFEAVLLYLIQWDIVDRWTRRNADTGQERFEQLVTDAMGQYANMFAEE
jgi:hypothetical protein